jgi:hypothetical protein
MIHDWCSFKLYGTSTSCNLTVHHQSLRKNQQARYQRRLLPIGNNTIVKEERCYLPDGTIMELRDIWTKDATKEE